MDGEDQQGPEMIFRDTERKLRICITELEAKVKQLREALSTAQQTVADWEDGYLTELETEVKQLKEELIEERTRR